MKSVIDAAEVENIDVTSNVKKALEGPVEGRLDGRGDIYIFDFRGIDDPFPDIVARDIFCLALSLKRTHCHQTSQQRWRYACDQRKRPDLLILMVLEEHSPHIAFALRIRSSPRRDGGCERIDNLQILERWGAQVVSGSPQTRQSARYSRAGSPPTDD